MFDQYEVTRGTRSEVYRMFPKRMVRSGIDGVSLDMEYVMNQMVSKNQASCISNYSVKTMYS